APGAPETHRSLHLAHCSRHLGRGRGGLRGAGRSTPLAAVARSRSSETPSRLDDGGSSTDARLRRSDAPPPRRAAPRRGHGARGWSVLPLDAQYAGMSALTVRALTVPGRLNGVSFALGSGTLAAAVGPNGSGKSTLLQAAAGLLPAAGDVELEGRPLPRIAVIDRARRLAWVPQEASFQFAFSVREVVAQGRYMWADDGNGVDDALTACDLRHLADRPVTRLSGGERQRVSLARAVATRAGLQLWDEPVAQLDVRHALQVMALARRFANGGAALLVSLHD